MKGACWVDNARKAVSLAPELRRPWLVTPERAFRSANGPKSCSPHQKIEIDHGVASVCATLLFPSYASGVRELPDVAIYVERLQAHLVGQRVNGLRLPKPFLVRTFEPPLTS